MFYFPYVGHLSLRCRQKFSEADHSHPKTASEGRRGASPFKGLPEIGQEKRMIRGAGLLHVYIYMYF
jgi:hypothetical protein